jgi:lipopolysaccharide transport system ATP-binding protein
VASLLEVGTGFHPELNGRENIYLNGAMLGMSRFEITRRFDEIVQFSGVERFLDTPVKRYSSGMYTRLAFAVAAHLDPEILIVDEVLAVGDAEFQKKCIGKMGEVTQDGRTVIFVSHNMAAVQALCKQGIVLEDGAVRCHGAISTCIDYYMKSGQHRANAIPLDARDDRSGRGQVRMTDLRLLDQSDNVVDRLSIAQPIRLQLKYHSEVPARHLRVQFGIYNMFNVPVLRFDSMHVEGLPTWLPARGQVVCTADPVALVPGIYSINACIQQQNDIEDHVTQAMFFEVADGDFYGTGRQLEGDWA